MDAALATCGYDLLEFQKGYPRVPRYAEDYHRAEFERLWEGIEHRCPCPEDGRWPEADGDSDYFLDDEHFYPDCESHVDGNTTTVRRSIDVLDTYLSL